MKKTLILPGLVGLSAFAATAGGSLVSAVGAHADTATADSTAQTTKPRSSRLSKIGLRAVTKQMAKQKNC